MSVTIYGIASPNMIPPPAAPPRTLWLVTMVDLVTLILAFFVMMFAMSQVETKKFDALAKSYGDTFSPVAESDEAAPRIKLPKLINVPGDNLAYLEAVLRAAFAGTATLRDVQFQRTAQYLILSLPVDGVFAPGSGAFTETAATPVFDLGGVLSNLKNRIAVVGTAVMTPADEAGTAAWSLALTRAQSMADALKTTGYDQPITVLGRGGAPSDVSAAIGRIDILIMPERPAS